MANNVFNLNQLSEIFEFVKFSKFNGMNLPICIWGEHGIGKTEIVTEYFKENYIIKILHLATQDVCDLIGIPKALETELNGNKVLIQQWACPNWLIEAKEQSKKDNKPALFFLDEFNRGTQPVLAAMLPFLIEGTLHTHKIGPNDIIIAAANPPTDDYEVNEINDDAFNNRVGHIIFKPTVKEYIDYLKNKKYHQSIINTLLKNPEYAKLKNFELNFPIKPSRRSIARVMNVIQKKPKQWIMKHGEYVIEAYLGEKFASDWLVEYSSYSIESNSIDIDIIKNSTIDELVNLMSITIEGKLTYKTDLLSKAIIIIRDYINSDLFSITDLDWIFKFFNLEILPDDASGGVFNNNPTILNIMINNDNMNIKIGEFMIKKNILNVNPIIKKGF